MRLSRDLRQTLKVNRVDVSQGGLALLSELKERRCLVTPSHSGGFEPHIVMHLSKLLGTNFHYVAAMELFAKSPVHRWLLQKLGVYSIIRGALDRPSFSMTRRLLAEGRQWLVVFPEGETIWQNSTIIPFQSGVIRLAFKALEDVDQADGDASLFCVPVAIKYVYLDDMHDEIDASLARLEAKLAVPSTARASNRYERLRAAAEVVLAAHEKANHVTADKARKLNDRIQEVKECIISRLEGQLRVKPTADQSLLDRVRALFNAVDRIIYEETAESEYERLLAQERQLAAQGLYHDLWRALRFVAVYDGYVSESMTVERFMDVLSLLEFEVFKRRPMWGPRKACVSVGQPIDLKDHYVQYLADKRQVVQTVTLSLEESVRTMLDRLGADCQPLRLS